MASVKCLGIKKRAGIQEFIVGVTCDPILAVLLNGHGTFGMLASRSVPQFPQIQDGVRVPNAQGCREEETWYP